jgi:XisI protein
MGQTMSYADILTKIVREEGRHQFSIQPIRIASVCDRENGEFLLIATGRDNDEWIDSGLFHARLVDGTVVIETDNIEEGLKPAMIEARIRAEDIVWGYKFDGSQATPIAA